MERMPLRSLYAQYVAERQNKHVIETDKGFASYQFLQDGVYIEDIYVLPDFRHEGVAASLADQIKDVAKAKGLSKLYGTVQPSSKNSTESLKVLLAYGFRLQSATQDAIFFCKEF